MKKHIILMLALVIGFAASAQIRLGHINSQELLEMMPEKAAAFKKAESLATELQKKLETMSAEYEQKVTDYQAKEATMSQTIKQSTVAEITSLQQRIQQFQTTAQEEIAKEEQRLLQPILDKARNAISNVAKTNGFAYIFDISSGATVYEGGENILPLVKKELGIQ
jgi:outer membrane protein